MSNPLSKANIIAFFRSITEHHNRDILHQNTPPFDSDCIKASFFVGKVIKVLMRNDAFSEKFYIALKTILS